jgi:L-iditol 2-dehydrogenase
MKQAVMTAPGEIMIHEVEEPKPGAGEVLLRIQRIGVCGSDVHVYHGKHPYTGYPVVQGHEFSASVVEVGPGVKDIHVGDKVTSMPQIVCGKCEPCLRGDYHICDELRVEGFQAPGCAQELWVAQAEKIIPLPSDFSYEQGALVEPVSVAVHACRRAGDLKGKNVAVLGAGPIGNLVAQVARSEGAEVLVTDISDFRLDIAHQCGLKNVVNPSKESFKDAVRRVFGKESFKVGFECVGVEATMTDAIETIAKGGTIVVVGVFGDKPHVDMGLVQNNELNLVGTLMYKREDYIKAVELIESGGVITAPLMSKHYTMEDYLQAYKFIDQARDKTMKVFIDIAP